MIKARAHGAYMRRSFNSAQAAFAWAEELLGRGFTVAYVKKAKRGG